MTDILGGQWTIIARSVVRTCFQPVLSVMVVTSSCHGPTVVESKCWCSTSTIGILRLDCRHSLMGPLIGFPRIVVPFYESIGLLAHSPLHLSTPEWPLS